VDYSCAIKLANPVVVKTAMYTTAHRGVLLKGSQALDALARMDGVQSSEVRKATSLSGIVFAFPPAGGCRMRIKGPDPPG
jgi:hypothetical protein